MSVETDSTKLLGSKLDSLRVVSLVEGAGDGEAGGGAGLADEAQDGVVVEKSTVEKDLIALRAALSVSVGRRARIRPPEPPNLVFRDDQTVVEATVHLRKGFMALNAATIAEECKKFGGEMTFRNLSDPDPDCIVSGKSIMGLMMLGAGEGTRIEISVAGTDTASETLARRLYGILTSRSYFDLKPDRFVAP